jgi:hypothetical protein
VASLKNRYIAVPDDLYKHLVLLVMIVIYSFMAGSDADLGYRMRGHMLALLVFVALDVLLLWSHLETHDEHASTPDDSDPHRPASLSGWSSPRTRATLATREGVESSRAAADKPPPEAAREPRQ